MQKQVVLNKEIIFYTDKGKGSVVVFIHGFLENANIWGKITDLLSVKYRIISIDLPGHGNSSFKNSQYSINDYASVIKSVIDYENIDKIFLTGHSMGGYVTMAFLENFPKRLSGLCLFHSHPFADSNDTKKAREIKINEIDKIGTQKTCIEHPPKVFAHKNVNKFELEIKEMQNAAISMQANAVKASIIAMKNRINLSNALTSCKVPFLFIAGKHDNFISLDILDKIKMPAKFKTVILENSGHMGMIEEPLETAKTIENFISNLIN